MNLRRARQNEAPLLNTLAFASEGYWGEDAAYMEAFSNEYAVTEHMIQNDYVCILEDDDTVIGFFAILKDGALPELEMFYVDRALIGKGYGTALWSYMLDFCRDQGIEKFGLVGSSDVTRFYQKMGATEIEKKASLLKTGRIVSRLEYEL